MQFNKCDSTYRIRTIHIKVWETSAFSFKMLCIRLLFLLQLSFAFDWDEAREHQAQANRKKDYVLSRIDMSNFTVLNATAYKEVCGFRLYVPKLIACQALQATNWAFRSYYRTVSVIPLFI